MSPFRIKATKWCRPRALQRGPKGEEFGFAKNRIKATKWCRPRALQRGPKGEEFGFAKNRIKAVIAA